MNKYVEYIRSQLDERTLLEQLAEESTELTQATLKIIRAGNLSENTTPISLSIAKLNFLEEWGDMLLVLYMLEYTDDEKVLENPKLKRWAERLGFKGSDEAMKK